MIAESHPVFSTLLGHLYEAHDGPFLSSSRELDITGLPCVFFRLVVPDDRRILKVQQIVSANLSRGMDADVSVLHGVGSTRE